MTPTEHRSELRRPAMVALVSVLAAIAGLAVTPRADAFIYWADGAYDTIGRANLDGGGANPELIVEAQFPASLDVSPKHLYWANFSSGTISRARLDGTQVNRRLVCDCSDPAGVAVHGSGVYWTSFAGSIGHANLDGSAAEREFIPLPPDSHPFGIAVDDEHVYWTRTFSDTIDRAAIDGSGIELGLIELAPHGADYVALDDEHVYWTNNVTDTIGRADLDGAGADERFIPLPANSHPYGIAVDASHIYWADIGTSAIGRVGLNGSNLDPRFVDLPPGALPYDVAIDGGSDTRLKGDASAKGVQEQRRERVRVEVRLKAEEPLSAALRGEVKLRGESHELTPKSRELGADARRSLNLAPRRRQDERTIAEALADGRRATAEVTAKLTDLAINTDSERLRVRLTG